MMNSWNRLSCATNFKNNKFSIVESLIMTIDEYAEHANNMSYNFLPTEGVPEMSRYRYRYSFTSFEQRVPVPSLRIVSTAAGVPEMSRYRYRYSFTSFGQRVRVPSLRMVSTAAGVPEMSRYRYRYSFTGFEQRVPSLRYNVRFLGFRDCSKTLFQVSC